MGNQQEFFQNKFKLPSLHLQNTLRTMGLFYNLTNKQINWHHRVSIRKFSELIGNLVASFPGIKIKQLFYRHLDYVKITGLI